MVSFSDPYFLLTVLVSHTARALFSSPSMVCGELDIVDLNNSNGGWIVVHGQNQV